MDYTGNKRLIRYTHLQCLFLNALVVVVIKTYGNSLVFYYSPSCRCLDCFNFLFRRRGKFHLSLLVCINNGFFFLVIFLHMLNLLFIFICLGCLSAGNNRFWAKQRDTS